MAKQYQKKIPLLDCGHEYIGEVLYGRWKIPLIWYIAHGTIRPGELQRMVPQASRRVLDNQLDQLNSHGIIKKTIYKEKIPRVEYMLTPLGLSLLPVIEIMKNWGNDNSETLRKVIQRPL